MKDGQIFYQGPVDEILSYYALKGQICPTNYNPSDFVMDLCQSQSKEKLTENGLFMPIPDRFVHENNNNKSTASTKMDMKELVFHFESGFFKQISILTFREFVNTYRDIHTISTKFKLTIFLNLLFGLIYLDAGKGDNSINEDLNTHLGAIMIVMMFVMMGSAQSVMLSFPYERPMVLREYVTGTCKSLISLFLLYPSSYH